MIDHEPIEINLDDCRNDWKPALAENLREQMIKRKLNPVGRISMEEWVKLLCNHPICNCTCHSPQKGFVMMHIFGCCYPCDVCQQGIPVWYKEDK